MEVITKYRNVLKERIRKELPDSLDRVILLLFNATLVFSSIKLIIAIPIYLDNHVLLPVVCFALFVCFVFGFMLYWRPRYLPALTKLGLIWMTSYIVLVIVFSPDQMNLVSIQHMFIIIMMAFYGLNRYWGLTFSALFIGLVIVYMFWMRNEAIPVSLFPMSFPFYSSFFIIMVNFVQIAYLHFMYNRTLTHTVREMKNINVQLNALLDAKSNFLSTMSHELRTPLNSVIGTAYLLIDSELEDSQRKNVQNLRFSAESLLILINDILDFSKMDSNHTRLESIPFSPSEVLEHVFSGMQQRAVSKSLDIKLDIYPDVRELKVLGDPARLTQIVYNLLGNSIKFTHIGRVGLEVQQVLLEDGRVMLRILISDTGIGIDAHMHEQIFEPFTQASTSINRQFGGTGLGLAIVKHLVVLHGGNIKLDSRVGEGSVFTVELPYKIYSGDLPSKVAGIGVEKTIIPVSLKGLNVMLAEDNQMSVLFMKQLLAKWDIEPVVAHDGEEAIQLYNSGHRFDIVLMDIHMPRVNGLEAVQYIRNKEQQTESRVYIIALTASVSDKLIGNLNDFGFDDYLGKPFRPNDLQLKLEKGLKKSVLNGSS